MGCWTGLCSLEETGNEAVDDSLKGVARTRQRIQNAGKKSETPGQMGIYVLFHYAYWSGHIYRERNKDARLIYG